MEQNSLRQKCKEQAQKILFKARHCVLSGHTPSSNVNKVGVEEAERCHGKNTGKFSSGPQVKNEVRQFLLRN